MCKDRIITINLYLLYMRVDLFINQTAELASSNNSECNFLELYHLKRCRAEWLSLVTNSW